MQLLIVRKYQLHWNYVDEQRHKQIRKKQQKGYKPAKKIWLSITKQKFLKMSMQPFHGVFVMCLTKPYETLW